MVPQGLLNLYNSLPPPIDCCVTLNKTLGRADLLVATNRLLCGVEQDTWQGSLKPRRGEGERALSPSSAPGFEAIGRADLFPVVSPWDDPCSIAQTGPAHSSSDVAH